MNEKQTFPFLAILGLIFITLKLTGVINWSWWLVLLPLYAGIAVVLGLLAICVVGIVIAAIIKKLIK